MIASVLSTNISGGSMRTVSPLSPVIMSCKWRTVANKNIKANLQARFARVVTNLVAMFIKLGGRRIMRFNKRQNTHDKNGTETYLNIFQNISHFVQYIIFQLFMIICSNRMYNLPRICIFAFI